LNEINIKYVDKLHPIFTKPKRIKIIVGGRGSTKSTGIADYVSAKLTTGELWCCARENQNSIEESVHRTILDEISRLEISGFEDTKTSITHIPTGGRTFYRGLARNITSLKSTLSGIDGLWVEEGEDISDNTLRVLTASVRLNAKDSQRLIEGEDVKMPEIIISMNRGRRDGAIAKKWLARAEKELTRCGYYEDDTLMVVQMNYTDMPKLWFMASGLEVERLDDVDKLSNAAYKHKWDGDYLDEVENSIIKGEWFDACVDAHKIDKLKKVFEPRGCKIAIHDPFNDGDDAGGYVLKHGSIIKKVRSKAKGQIDIVCDWATTHAINDGADWFVWDYDGMGTGLKRQVSINFKGTNIKYHGFRGSLSGKAQDNAELIYQPLDDSKDSKSKTYKETFLNNRSQYYIKLADKMFNTYKCVVRGDYINPENMISFDSEGVENLIDLRSQLTRIPRVLNGTGLQQIMNKKEMKSNKIDSPNEGDCVMMSGFTPPITDEWGELDYGQTSMV
jgi:phage terminase large subunit